MHEEKASKTDKNRIESIYFRRMYMIYQDNCSWQLLLTFLVIEMLLWKVFALACDWQEQLVVLPNMKDNSVCLWSTVNSLYTNENCQKHDEKVRYFFIFVFPFYLCSTDGTCLKISYFKKGFNVIL